MAGFASQLLRDPSVVLCDPAIRSCLNPCKALPEGEEGGRMRSRCHFPLSSGFDCRLLEKSEIEHDNPDPRHRAGARNFLPPHHFSRKEPS